MDLESLRRNWDEFGRTDPLWAVLSLPSKRHGRWDHAEFFATGVFEIETLMDYLATLPVQPARRRALDFGCGVGRLTQALCRFFRKVHGVDIAAAMLEEATRFNRFGTRCRYHLNTRADLALFAADGFDLVYSNLVLQHMEPQYSEHYVAEFVRVLRPGGLAIFAIPSEPRTSSIAWAHPADPSPFRASIAPQVTGSLAGETGARLALRVRVTNVGDEPWPATREGSPRYSVRLGNHWLTAEGRMWQQDDGRAALPDDVLPGRSVDLTLGVNLPLEPGEYQLEFDMVQEAVAWFHSRGSPSVKLPVTVTGPPGPPPGTAVMEIHCLPRETVTAVVEHAGGRVVDVQESGGPGPDYIEYRYCVTKSRPGPPWWRTLLSARR